MRIDDCVLINLPTMNDSRGSLTVADRGGPVPFDVQRVFWVYDVPAGEHRGAHAHRELHQFLLCLHGGLDVSVTDGNTTRSFRVEKPSQGLYIPPMIWASESNFAPGTVFMVLASHAYDSHDYLRNFDDFLKAVRQ